MKILKNRKFFFCNYFKYLDYLVLINKHVNVIQDYMSRSNKEIKKKLNTNYFLFYNGVKC